MSNETEEYIWIPDSRTITSAPNPARRCRLNGHYRRCDNPVTWAFRRSNGMWWYCEEHLEAYGGKRIDGQIYHRVHRDSPAAKASR